MYEHVVRPPAHGFPQTAALSHHYGGSLRSGIHSALSSVLFVSGLWLWLWPEASLVMWLHLTAGLVLAAALGPWLLRHLPPGLAHSQRHLFTRTSWALLATWVALIGSGLVMALPGLMWLAGLVWFLPREITEALSLLHFWASWLAMAGLVLHLALRHWACSAI